MRRSWLFSLLCLLLCVSNSRAENPRLSLRLRQVTCAEAAAALEKQSGETVSLMEIPVQRTPGVPRVDLSERADWDWTNATLADALRQLALRYRLTASGGPTGYQLIPRFGPYGNGPQDPRGRWEGHGVKIGVTNAGWNRSSPGDQRLSVQFSVETAGLDGDRLAAITHVSARDDLGNILTADERSQNGQLQRQLPDTFVCAAIFPDPPEIGSRLVWIEGEVALYPSVKHRTLRFSLPEEGHGSVHEDGRWRVTLQEVVPGRASPPDDVIAPRNVGPIVNARVTLPSRVTRDSETRQKLQILLIGDSGKQHLSGEERMSLVGRLGDPTYDFHCQFGAIREGLSRVEFRLQEAEEPLPAFRFRLKDVPLPSADADTGYGPAPFRGLFAGKEWGPDQPYFAAAGAVLRLPVRTSGRPAPAGGLSIGLARNGPEGPEPLHWVSMRTQPGGAGQIAGLAPGSYRLLRHFRPDEAPVRQPPGRWRNTEVTITAGTGPVTVAALEWAPEAAR